jgi:DNA-binding transcriptional MerR regulator
MKADSLNIGELAKRSGLATSNIRFYEARGLIRNVKRLANGYRSYPLQTLRTLELIKCGQEAGFSLEELALLLPDAEPGSGKHAEVIASLEHKVQQIADMQVRLAQNREKLLGIIHQLKVNPEGSACEARAERVMEYLREEL